VQGEGTHESAAELVAVEGDVEGAGCEAGFHGGGARAVKVNQRARTDKSEIQEQTTAKY
jgi:hypothetical protein